MRTKLSSFFAGTLNLVPHKSPVKSFYIPKETIFWVYQKKFYKGERNK